MFKVNGEVLALSKILSMPIESGILGKKKYYTEYAILKQLGGGGHNQRITKKFIEMGILVLDDGKYYIDVEEIDKYWQDSVYYEVYKKIQKLKPPF